MIFSILRFLIIIVKEWLMPSDLLVWHGLTKFDPLAPHLLVSGNAHREEFSFSVKSISKDKRRLVKLKKFFFLLNLQFSSEKKKDGHRKQIEHKVVFTF